MVKKIRDYNELKNGDWLRIVTCAERGTITDYVKFSEGNYSRNRTLKKIINEFIVGDVYRVGVNEVKKHYSNLIKEYNNILSEINNTPESCKEKFKKRGI